MNIRTYIKHLISEGQYDDYNTSVIALFHQRKVLILQRGSTAPWMPNKWSIVGGVVDAGEDFRTAVIRETSEEIGLNPRNVKQVKQMMTPDSGNIIYFTGMLDSDNVNLDYENQDYQFIDEPQLANFQFVPYVVDFLKDCFAQLR